MGKYARKANGDYRFEHDRWMRWLKRVRKLADNPVDVDKAYTYFKRGMGIYQGAATLDTDTRKT